jgi:uncharacterized sulfatase
MKTPLRLVLGLAVALGCALRLNAEPPNIVLIVSDDHGWTDYGFMGHPHVKTPNLDRLAAQSVTYKRGYVPSSLCCPSLATIITGLPPHRHKITSNDPPRPDGLKPAEFQKSKAFLDGREVMNKHLDAVPTLPRLLAKQGYVSLQTGKWWQGDYRRGGFTHGMTKGQRHGDEGLDIGRRTMQPVFDFIADARKGNKPFFVWYAPMMPHTPHNPPDRLLAKYKDKTPPLPVARYWAMVEWFDETCGQLLDHLEQQKLAENTLVIYVTDNGWIQNPEAADSVRSKRTPYDAGLRTPIMVRWPGKAKPAVREELVSSLDVAPTILRAAGLTPTAEMPGLNLLDPVAVAARKELYGACFTHNAVDLNDPAKNVRHRWMTDGRWKLIVPHVPADKDGPGTVELYDLSADPHEKTELSGKHPEQVRALTEKLDRWWKPGS